MKFLKNIPEMLFGNWQNFVGEVDGTPLQYSCLENPMDGGAWQAAVHGVAKSRTLSLFTFMHWRRKWQPTPVFLPGESQGRGSLVDCSLWGRTELDTTEATQQQQQQDIHGEILIFCVKFSLFCQNITYVNNTSITIQNFPSHCKFPSCLSLMIKDAEDFFTCFLAIHISAFAKCLFVFFTCF